MMMEDQGEAEIIGMIPGANSSEILADHDGGNLYLFSD